MRLAKESTDDDEIGGGSGAEGMALSYPAAWRMAAWFLEKSDATT